MRFQVDAASVTDFQTCRRRFILNSEWRLARWRPKLLFDVLLRRGILQLTKAKEVVQVAAEAKSIFLQRAAEPGLDIVGKDPYQESKGWTSLLESVLHGLARTSLPVLHDPAPVLLTFDIDWRFLSWADDSGTLHRWVTVESWDSDTLSREMHSWRTFGDLVMSGCPMVLHAIIIGQHRNGRFMSPWTRTYEHPAVRNRWQWIKPEDTTWKPLQFVDQNRLDVDEWIDQACSQGAIRPLLRDQSVELPEENVIRDTKRQMSEEAMSMVKLLEKGTSYFMEPMSRGACHLYVPCAFLDVCYSSDIVPIDKLGLYVPRKASYSNFHTEVPVR